VRIKTSLHLKFILGAGITAVLFLFSCKDDKESSARKKGDTGAHSQKSTTGDESGTSGLSEGGGQKDSAEDSHETVGNKGSTRPTSDLDGGKELESRRHHEGRPAGPRGGSFDIMTGTFIHIKRNLMKAYKRGKKAVYSVSLSNPDAKLLSTEYQKVQPTGRGKYILTVRRPDYKKLPSTKLPVKDKDGDLGVYLKPSPTLQSNAPLIIQLAQKAARGSTDGLEVAKRLEEFVFKYVNEKDYSVAAATALDVAKTRKGDCSEHAYLLAALARAAGLPSRVVSGLLFAPKFMDKRNIFIYHMWAEMRLGGKWVPFDATRPVPGVGVTHISLAVDDMSSMIPIGGTAIIMRTIGQMAIQVKEVTLE